jgi:hypothetical protein
MSLGRSRARASWPAFLLGMAVEFAWAGALAAAGALACLLAVRCLP